MQITGGGGTPRGGRGLVCSALCTTIAVLIAQTEFWFEKDPLFDWKLFFFHPTVEYASIIASGVRGEFTKGIALDESVEDGEPSGQGRWGRWAIVCCGCTPAEFAFLHVYLVSIHRYYWISNAGFESSEKGPQEIWRAEKCSVPRREFVCNALMCTVSWLVVCSIDWLIAQSNFRSIDWLIDWLIGVIFEFHLIAIRLSCNFLFERVFSFSILLVTLAFLVLGFVLSESSCFLRERHACT